MKKIKVLLIWFVIALAVCTYLFLSEVLEWAKDGYVEFVAGSTIAATKEDTPLINGYVLEPEKNNARLIQVTNLAFVGKNNNQLTINFDLINSGASNDYPSLKVVSFDQARQIIGQTVFSNSDYTHGVVFSSETVKLSFEIPPGTSSIEVLPFYPKQGKLQ